MYRSVGLLVDSPSQLEEVARQVASATSASVTATSDPAVWRVAFGHVGATLTANHPDIAGEALARRYRYAIAARMADGSTQATSDEVRVLREAGRALRDDVELPALLVLDVQNSQAVPQQATDGQPPEGPERGEVGA